VSQAEPVRTSLPRRDRLAIWTGLTGVTVLAWIYLVVQARQMASMPGSMPMEAMPEMVGVSLWSLGDFVLMFLMWAVMMVGMMVPTAAPMTLIYAAVARKAAAQANPLPPTAVFVSGYIAMWGLFSVVATLAQWGLDQAALISPMMVGTSPMLGAGLLIAAGAYQLTPFKNACLKHCRGPAEFFAAHWRDGTLGAFRMGLEHGAYCLGCCWVLMGLLFLGGVMNLVWVAAIAVFVLLEKVIPFGAAAGRFAGAAMIVIGLLLLFQLG
jgi:predicted metal-binding membrane protein